MRENENTGNMKDQKDVLKRFYESLNMDGQFHILERRVPVEEQVEYFKHSSRLRKSKIEITENDYEQYVEDLKHDELSIENKKRILSVLASSRQIRAYRLLEDYAKQSDSGLVNWAYMALMESRIALESELSDEEHIYISSGLGGRGQKLRFYVLVRSSDKNEFLDYQRAVIDKEFRFYLQKEDCEIERLTIKENYLDMLFLMPIRSDIRRILENAINECNLYGNFLSETFTVTNVKELTRAEVKKIIENDQTSR